VLEDAVLTFNPGESGRKWDLALVPSTWLGRLEQHHAILEVPAHHWQRLQEVASPLALLAGQSGGKMVGYPLLAQVPVLIYSPTYFVHAPTSLESLVRAPFPAEVLPLALNLHDLNLMVPLLASALGKEAGLRPEELGEAWAKLQKLLAPALGSQGLLLGLEPHSEALQAQLFAQGKLAAFVGGPEAVAALQDGPTPVAVLAIPPACEGCRTPRPWASFISVAVSALAPYPDLAQGTALALASPGQNVQLAGAANALPVVGPQEAVALVENKPGMLGVLRALAAARLAPPEDEWQALKEAWEALLLSLSQAQSSGLQEGNGRSKR
jgi:maltose-binding protein MalE